MTKEKEIKDNRKARRTSRIRKKIRSVSDRPRLLVFRSNKYFYAQIVDDKKGLTILGVTEKDILDKKGISRIQRVEELGKILAVKAKEKKIKEVAFDKGHYKYHGLVKKFAEGARSGGLVF